MCRLGGQQRGKREKSLRDRESRRSGVHFEIKGKSGMKERETGTHTAETDNTAASSGQRNLGGGGARTDLERRDGSMRAEQNQT